ncbi:hypothetical protein THAOC_12053 [Thalassiosira oceanica]|uniref:Uncharacterized protein n=1 Tax=Thalassiosira oceanica TaxID=159749 RepID=K0SPP3_THAOC|nr:hypothetical protein THAOC_12053 [Thalassiosira oceanica]|eukprot:EJK66969.1 hypothetical protein THAOC_12053 [Thalassiosira oceanica]
MTKIRGFPVPGDDRNTIDQPGLVPNSTRPETPQRLNRGITETTAQFRFPTKSKRTFQLRDQRWDQKVFNKSWQTRRANHIARVRSKGPANAPTKLGRFDEQTTRYSQLCIMTLGKHSNTIASDHFELEGGGGRQAQRNADAEGPRNLTPIMGTSPANQAWRTKAWQPFETSTESHATRQPVKFDPLLLFLPNVGTQATSLQASRADFQVGLSINTINVRRSDRRQHPFDARLSPYPKPSFFECRNDLPAS